ncbi:hypothetical protein F5882DRAFT_2366 [Hyaloscypha sp. PMI_1271]|nr:hypothetical protein F5882DRAFT_2366 [Hyaloscypha sp. PMI_1271]
MQAIGLGVGRVFVPDLCPSTFRTAFALQWLVGGPPIVAFFLVPESPNYLPLKGRTEGAHSSLARIYGKRNHIDARLARLKSRIQQEMNAGKKPNYLDCTFWVLR